MMKILADVGGKAQREAASGGGRVRDWPGRVSVRVDGRWGRRSDDRAQRAEPASGGSNAGGGRDRRGRRAGPGRPVHRFPVPVLQTVRAERRGHAGRADLRAPGHGGLPPDELNTK